MALDVPFDRRRHPVAKVRFGRNPEELTFLRALVDTGAESSCIGTDVARPTGLPRVDKRAVRDVERRIDCDVFEGHIVVGDLRVPSPRQFVGLPGLGAEHAFQVILGQDILANLLMHQDGPNRRMTLLRPDEWTTWLTTASR